MVLVEHVRSDIQLADIFTKSLGRVHYLHMQDKIGLKDASENGKVTGANVNTNLAIIGDPILAETDSIGRSSL